VPEVQLLRALRFAAWAGADVRLIVPRKIDLPFMRFVNRIFYRVLIRGGVRIDEYAPRILHAKTMLIDDWAVVGSSNLNHRSLISDLEVDVVLTQPESITSLETQFLEDAGQAVRILDKDLQSGGFRGLLRALERFILRFRDWL
jgi:cardiolipin synthase